MIDMDIIRASSISEEILKNGPNRMPLIICSDSARVFRKIKDAGYINISINAELSKRLLKYEPENRLLHLEAELNQIVACHVPALIFDFEMLFDPRYKIDVVKFFCDKARTVNLAIKWPGKYVPGKLFYAGPEDQDYHEYNCNSYQIRIVQ